MMRRTWQSGRVALGLASAMLVERYRPLMANFIVIRRCNLSCGYCTEYDDSSAPIPLAVLGHRLDHLARLRTLLVSLTGGEPLLHPELPAIVRAVRARGMTAAVSTNGFLLTRKWIEELNDAGTFAMQVSVDGTKPNEVTQKALKTVLPRLELLARHARFRVRINTVLGAAPPDEALDVVRTVMALGLEAKCSLLREKDGRVAPIDARTRDVYRAIERIEGRQPAIFDETFQQGMLEDGGVEWKCRAGGRFFHVDEHGLVDLCAPRSGSPGKPLADYTEADLRYAFEAPKPCASRCPVAYAHQLSRLDAFRPQRGDTYPIERTARTSSAESTRGHKLPIVGHHSGGAG
jgi:MoaA/NifB/PqqE/SkfB family radical SAM enzyme